MTYKIEKGVPIPSVAGKTGLIESFRSMEIGDSIFFEGKKHTQISPTLVRLKPMKFTARTVEGGVRIWRVE